MQELRSIVQKALRNPDLLPDGWPQLFYFIEEYLETLANDPSKLLLFLVEDHARCPHTVLEQIFEVLRARKKVKIEDYRRVSYHLGKLPLDRSAAYLSVACLKDVSPISDEKKRHYLSKCCERWEWYFDPETEEDTKDSFVTCMDFLVHEVKVVPREYPMTPTTALRLAAAVSHLVAWDLMHPKVRLDKRVARNNLARNFRRNIDSSVRVVRPLLLGFVAADNWMARAHKTMDPRAKELVEMYLELAIACCANASARLDLIVMNALLVLMGHIPDPSTIDVPSGYPPCNLDDIPTDPRAFPMPDVAQDRHTLRGKNMVDTTNSLKKRCEKLCIPIPKNIGYSHGPPSNNTKQGFEEFMEHIRLCEEHRNDGIEPLFKEKALEVYRSLPAGIPKKRLEILKHKLQISGEAPRKPVPNKRKQKDDACHLETKRQMNRAQEDS